MGILAFSSRQFFDKTIADDGIWHSILKQKLNSLFAYFPNSFEVFVHSYT